MTHIYLAVQYCSSKSRNVQCTVYCIIVSSFYDIHLLFMNIHISMLIQKDIVQNSRKYTVQYSCVTLFFFGKIRLFVQVTWTIVSRFSIFGIHSVLVDIYKKLLSSVLCVLRMLCQTKTAKFSEWCKYLLLSAKRTLPLCYLYLTSGRDRILD